MCGIKNHIELDPYTCMYLGTDASCKLGEKGDAVEPFTFTDKTASVTNILTDRSKMRCVYAFQKLEQSLCSTCILFKDRAIANNQ